MKKLLFSAGRVVIFSYVGILVLLFGCQRSYIYYPRRAPESALLEQAAGAGLVAWRDNDGALLGWRSPHASASARRVMVLHGNAGCAVDRDYYVRVFAARPGGGDWEVFLFEYPGYGARRGKPGEAALQEAAAEALEYLYEENRRPVFLLGESLGSGVAGHLAAQHPDLVAGLLLVTPFTSMADVAAVHYPWLPVRWLLRDRFETDRALQSYDGPVAVLLAGRDEVVPARLGRTLYEHYEGPKKLFVQEEATHNTLDLSPGAAWWDEAAAFLLQESTR